MATTQTFTFSLGRSKAGLLPSPGLQVQLKDTTGTAVGAPITSGFVELGDGGYAWTASIPDNFRGSASLTAVSSATVLSVLSVNPEEGEMIAEIHGALTTGSGTVLVDHDYGGTDALRLVTPSGQGAGFVTIRAFLASDYTAGHRSSDYVQGRTTTLVDGRWRNPLSLIADAYKLVCENPGRYGPDVFDITVS